MLHHGLHAGLEVRAVKKRRSKIEQEFVRGAHAMIQECAHHALGGCVGPGGSVGKLLGPCHGLRVQRCSGHHPIDDVPALERCGVIKIAGEADLSCARRTTALGQKMGSTKVGCGADLLFDLRKLRIIGGDDDVASQCDFKRFREAQPLNGADDRNVRPSSRVQIEIPRPSIWRAPLLSSPTKVVFTFTPQPK